ncbi:hypothetical protein GRF29_185g707443 [Pseudopithomyces chartarum]|uniref:Required for respiratory growth protein 7, mitochondrial n=1 Tax=Pseudopithomyces chartarum TaxID=1892770 RepID=A0AAN6LRE2_9PLEO|nr:hypothetical protein GRF29_185g707443 [Pseudopithomyces chartarum]
MRLLVRPTWLTHQPPLWRLLRTSPPSAVHHTSTANAAHADIPKFFVKPGSSHHNSLASFLVHAERANLRPERTVYIGTHYEYTTADALLRFGFSLIRTGQKNDYGIDLVGYWMLSCLREPMPVIIQCKARAKTCSPVEIRELEGSFTSVPADWRNKDVLGILVSPERASEGLRKQMHTSRRPMAFLQISRAGMITQFIWNRAAAERGLEGVGVTPRYTVLPPENRDHALEKGALRYEDRPRDSNGRWMKDPDSTKRLFKPVARTVITDIQLTWLGTPISPNKETLASETARLTSRLELEASKLERRHKPGRKPGRPLGSKNRPKVSESEQIKKPPRIPKPRAKMGRPPGSSERYPFDGGGCGEIVAQSVVLGKRGRPRIIVLPND